MNKLLLIALSTFALSSFAISAHSWEPSFYAGANLNSLQHKRHDFSPSHFTINSLEGVGGANLLSFIAVEGRLGMGLTEDRDADTGTDLRENYYASLYLRPYLKNERASLYGLLGFTAAEVSSNNANLDNDGAETGLSYGIGVSFVMSPKVDFTAEWKKQINADDFDIRGGSVGFIYKF